MKCELCGTEVKVVGGTTKHYEPVVKTGLSKKQLKDIVQNAVISWEINEVEVSTKPKKIEPLNLVDIVTDKVYDAMNGGTDE